MRFTLNMKEIPASAIGLPTRGAVIESAEWTSSPACGKEGENVFYKITGQILSVDESVPNICFRLNIPENWNGKLVQIGGAAYNGYVVSGESMDSCYGGVYCTPLEDNYATFGSDSGHQGDMWDPSFAADDEVFLNYAYEHIKKTKDAVCAIIKELFGKDADKVYYFGASTGGREAMEGVEHYPEDYDGILAACPGITLISRAIHDSAVMEAQIKDGGAGWISPEKWDEVEAVVYEFCDELDGVKDGLIGNIEEAVKKQDEIVAALRERKILTDAQIEALEVGCKTWQSDFPLAEETTTLPGWNWLSGGAPYDLNYLPGLPIRNYGSAPGMRDGQMTLTAYTLLQWMCMRSPEFDPETFKIDEHRAEIRKGSEMVDAASVDLDKFVKKGGKILMTHGTCDQFITLNNALEYYRRLAERYGEEELKDFYKLYLVPGMGHTAGGKFLGKTDFLAVLDQWVCEGKEPEKIVLTDLMEGHNLRTRPAYPYPAYAVYNGSGDVDSADSFHSSLDD